MPAHRYRPPNGVRPEEETLPLDTDLTILTRQSRLKQRERNTFSAELNPDELMREGQRLDFQSERIKVYDWDMLNSHRDWRRPSHHRSEYSEFLAR